MNSLDSTKLALMKMKNVFVTNQGVCLTDLSLVLESVHAYEDNVKLCYQNALIELDRSTLDSGRNNTLYLMNNDIYIIIHNPWFNYYHWITESIPRIWITKFVYKEDLSKLTLILPSAYKNISYVIDSLSPFAFKKIIFIPKSNNLFVKNLFLPQLKPLCDEYENKVVNDIRNFYTNYVKENSKIDHKLGKKIYISRVDAPHRRIINENEILDLLKKFDYRTVLNSKMSFYEQISIYSNACHVIGCHGAGLTNLHFMKEGSNILELNRKKKIVSDHHSHVYEYLADNLKINYFSQNCEPCDAEQNFHKADLIVDKKALFEKFQENFFATIEA